MTYLTDPHIPVSRARLRAAITQLVHRHGFWTVLRVALFAHPRPKTRIDNIGPHLRQDLGHDPHPKDWREGLSTQALLRGMWR